MKQKRTIAQNQLQNAEARNTLIKKRKCFYQDKIGSAVRGRSIGGCRDGSGRLNMPAEIRGRDKWEGCHQSQTNIQSVRNGGVEMNKTGEYATLTIIGELTDLNAYINAERSNRHAGAKIKKHDTELCLWQMKGKFKPILKPVVVVCTWYTKDERKDPDNVAFSKKFLLDAIVKAGILKNDGRKQIKGFEDKFEVDKNERVEVELWELV